VSYKSDYAIVDFGTTQHLENKKNKEMAAIFGKIVTSGKLITAIFGKIATYQTITKFIIFNL